MVDGFSGIGERYLLSIVAWGRTSTGSRSGFRTRAEGLVDSSSHHRLLLVTWTPVRSQARNILVHGDRRNVTVLNIVTLKDRHTRSSNRMIGVRLGKALPFTDLRHELGQGILP